MKNYPHQVIRLRKGKPGVSQVNWLVVILNTKKESSHKIIERLGFFRHGPSSLFSIDYERLSYHLNKGVILKNSVKRYIHWYASLYKFFKIKERKKALLKLKKNKKIFNKI